jgi:hypothetical protein
MLGRGRSREVYRVYADDDFLRAEDIAPQDNEPQYHESQYNESQYNESQYNESQYNESQYDESQYNESQYTAPPRGVPRALEGRRGVVLMALVAMALSALIVHVLRTTLLHGIGAQPAAPALATSAAPRPARRRGVGRGGADVRHAIAPIESLSSERSASASRPLAGTGRDRDSRHDRSVRPTTHGANRTAVGIRSGPPDHAAGDTLDGTCDDPKGGAAGGTTGAAAGGPASGPLGGTAGGPAGVTGIATASATATATPEFGFERQ